LRRELRLFHQEMRALWTRTGKADARALSKRTGLPPARFEFLFRPDAHEVLAEWLDVKALLVAAGEPIQTYRTWEERWMWLYDVIRDPRRGARWLREPEETSAIEKLVNIALEARDPGVFVTQLEQLRQLQGKSFAAIEKGSATTVPQKDQNKPRVERLARSTAHRMVQPGNFPTRASDVRMFVRACDIESEEMVEKWVLSYTRAAQRRHAQSVLEKTKAYHADPDQASVVEEVVDQLATQGAYFEAIRFLKAAYHDERSRRLTLEKAQPTGRERVFNLADWTWQAADGAIAWARASSEDVG
jgi:hypothetical protein